METKFVVPFQSPQKVYRIRGKSFFGVFDGARKFDNGMFAVLKDGVVTLYGDAPSGRSYEVWADLEDVFVAPSGWMLLKKRNSDEWQLYDRSKKGPYATGEKAAVFQEDWYCLVFLKQKGDSQWYFWNLYGKYFLPDTKILEADKFDVRYDKFGPYSSRLMFIVTLDGKKTLQRMDTLRVKPTEILSAPYYYCLPNGLIAIDDNTPLKISEGRFSALVLPEKKCKLYSAFFKFQELVCGVAVVGQAVLLRRDDGSWALFAGDELVKEGIVDVEMYYGVMSYAIGIQGKTPGGKNVDVFVRILDGKVVFNYGNERFFIFSGNRSPVVVQADGMNDVFII